MRVHLAGLASTRDAAGNRAAALAAVARGARDGAELVVLPEYAAAFEPRGVGVDLAEPLDGPFVSALLGASHGITVVAGLVTPAAGDPGRVTNLVVAVSGGELVGTYAKVHLYDAFAARESDLAVGGAPGVPPLVVEVGGLQVGVLTCYDLRFPESARRCVDAGATVLAVPAAWAGSAQNRDLKVDHWRTLLRARAIESTSYVLGVAMRGPGVVGPLLVVDPLGRVAKEVDPPAGSAGPGLVDGVTADLDPAQVASAREANPSLANRRYRVEPEG